MVALFLLFFGASAEDAIHRFLEVRVEAQSVSVYEKPTSTSRPLFHIRPRNLVQIELTHSQLKEMQRAEIESETIWLELASKQGWVPYHWKNFFSFPPSSELGIEVTPSHDYKKDVVTLFHEPGAISWRDCAKDPKLCQVFPTEDAHLYLANTRFVSTGEKVLLFYQLAYHHPDGIKNTVGHGWIWSGNARRKLATNLRSLVDLRDLEHQEAQKQILQAARKRNLNVEHVDKLLETQSAQTMKQMSMFGGEAEKRFNRWVSKQTRAPSSVDAISSTVKRELDLTVDFHFVADLQTYSLRGKVHEGTYTQQGMRLGLGGVMPIFLDLELMGTLFTTFPISQSDSDLQAISLIDFEQAFLVPTRYTLGGAPVKMGFAGDLQLYRETPFDTGYRALIGARYAAVVEAETFFSHFMFGPVLNTKGISFSNNELLLRGGYRLNRSDPFHSWSLMGEIRYMSFETDIKNRSAQQSVLSFGLHRGF